MSLADHIDRSVMRHLSEMRERAVLFNVQQSLSRMAWMYEHGYDNTPMPRGVCKLKTLGGVLYIPGVGTIRGEDL